MTFYLKPPRGDIHLEKILNLCRGRCQFLNLLDEADIEQNGLVILVIIPYFGQTSSSLCLANANDFSLRNLNSKASFAFFVSF
jgi:hypothetical protein